MNDTPDEAYHLGREYRVQGMPMLMNPWLYINTETKLRECFDRGYMDEDTALRTGVDDTQRVTA